MVISRTPFRISFFGGGTDYPVWYKEHGGAVIAMAIDKYCYITCRELPRFFDYNIRAVYSNIELCSHVDELDHPSIRETLKHLDKTNNIEIHHDGDIPARSGIGSSSSFTVGLVNAVRASQGLYTSKKELAEIAIHIEQNLIGECVGSQDQILAAYGGFNYVEFKDKDFSVTPIIGNAEKITRNILLVFTGMSRVANDVTKCYDFKKAERELTEMQVLTREGLMAVRDGDWNRFGLLIDEGWKLKKAFSDKITTPLIDDMYDKAKKAGAVSAKLIGAGSGGFLMIYAEPEKHPGILEALGNPIHVPFSVDSMGSSIIYYNRGNQ